MTKFGLDKRNALPPEVSLLQVAFRFFYSHVAPYMDKMKELLLIRQAPAGVIPWARTMKTNR